MTLNSTAKGLLLQLKDIIEQLKPEHYSAPCATLNNSTLGQHIRHTIEFFLCLMDAKNQGKINYDERKHDEFIQTDEKLAMSVIDSLVDFLSNEIDDFHIEHEANYELEEGQTVGMGSSFYRELSYNIEHAIHHMALIKIGIQQHFDYVQLPPHFGVASSTVRHQQKQQ